MDLSTPPTAPETVVFVLVPEFSMLAFTAAIEPLRIANRLAGRDVYDWVAVSGDGAPVRASNGVEVTVATDLGSVDLAGPLPVVLVCSGPAAEGLNDERLFAWLREVDLRGAVVGGLCTGAFVLARAGLLEGRRCAIHWSVLPAFVDAFPEIDVAAEPHRIDRNRLTCGCGTAALELMLGKIALDHGADLATRVAEQCLLDRIDGPDERGRLPIRARLGVHHPKLILALELMEANVEEPLGQELLAAYVGLSRRQVERLFKEHVGRTPAQYYLELRLERARNLIYRGDLSIREVARVTGFVSASHFSTCYRQLYGRTPREERRSTLNLG
ncbi:MAG: GlxA family transcriptional regulator [Pseudomonadota bacterium]